MGGSIRPDILYGLHQCVRLAHDPKHSHKIGVKHIAWYLKGTNMEEIIMKPNSNNLCIDMYADTDFAGLYSTEDKLDSVSVKSRSGILLTFGNVPTLWSSKLQSEIALSTLEAEYIAFSQGMRDLVSAMLLMAESGKHMNYELAKVSHVSKV